MLWICERVASITCSGHPSARAASAIFSVTCSRLFSLLVSVSVRHVDTASKAAFTALRFSFERLGADAAAGRRSAGVPPSRHGVRRNQSNQRRHIRAHSRRGQITSGSTPSSTRHSRWMTAALFQRCLRRFMETDTWRLQSARINKLFGSVG